MLGTGLLNVPANGTAPGHTRISWESSPQTHVAPRLELLQGQAKIMFPEEELALYKDTHSTKEWEKTTYSHYQFFSRQRHCTQHRSQIWIKARLQADIWRAITVSPPTILPRFLYKRSRPREYSPTYFDLNPSFNRNPSSVSRAYLICIQLETEWEDLWVFLTSPLGR